MPPQKVFLRGSLVKIGSGAAFPRPQRSWKNATQTCRVSRAPDPADRELFEGLRLGLGAGWSVPLSRHPALGVQQKLPGAA